MPIPHDTFPPLRRQRPKLAPLSRCPVSRRYRRLFLFDTIVSLLPTSRTLVSHVGLTRFDRFGLFGILETAVSKRGPKGTETGKVPKSIGSGRFPQD